MNDRRTIQRIGILFATVGSIAALFYLTNRKGQEELQLLAIRDQVITVAGYEVPENHAYNFSSRTNNRNCDKVFSLSSTFAPQYAIEDFDPTAVINGHPIETAEQVAKFLEDDPTVTLVRRLEEPSVVFPGQSANRYVDWRTSHTSSHIFFGSGTSFQTVSQFFKDCNEDSYVEGWQGPTGFRPVDTFGSDANLSE